MDVAVIDFSLQGEDFTAQFHFSVEFAFQEVAEKGEGDLLGQGKGHGSVAEMPFFRGDPSKVAIKGPVKGKALPGFYFLI